MSIMIDSHCHLEQKDYNKDRDDVIEKCKKAGLKAIITSCAHPKDFDLTMQIVDKWKGFVFATIGIHPQFIKKISQKEIDEFLELIKENKHRIVGIGECGLDYHYIKDLNWREKQKQLFIQIINFAKELNKPLVIHSWDADEDAVKILEQEDVKQVQMHMFESNQLTKRVIENGWYISTNAIILKSKKRKKVVRDCPLERLMLETDAPWLAPEGWESRRNNPRAVKIVAEKIAEIKKISVEDVLKKTTENAVRFFSVGI